MAEGDAGRALGGGNRCRPDVRDDSKGGIAGALRKDNGLVTATPTEHEKAGVPKDPGPLLLGAVG